MVCEMFSWILLSLVHAQPCNDYQRPKLLLRVNAEELLESSGLAPSQVRPNVFYSHNDSGSDAAVFGFSTQGGRVEKWPLNQLGAEDWEDMASGPCPLNGESKCLFIGDIGDNLRRREHVQIYAIPESANGPQNKVVGTWSLAYPNGPEDAETLLVHPKTGRVYVVTKRSQRPAVYRAPQHPTSGKWDLVATLDEERMGLRIPKLTGGDFSADGKRVVLRGYLGAWEWDVDLMDSEKHWREPPSRRVPIRLERQGEAITYGASGAIFTSSEGRPMPLTRIGCGGGNH